MAVFAVSPGRDVAQIVGALMQVTAGAELSVIEVETLTFEADGVLEAALNAAFITLLEFAHDAGIRARDPAVDRAMRRNLQRSLEQVGRVAGDLVEIGAKRSGAKELTFAQACS